MPDPIDRHLRRRAWWKLQPTQFTFAHAGAPDLATQSPPADWDPHADIALELPTPTRPLPGQLTYLDSMH